MAVGTGIRFVRIARKLSQKDIAKMAGCSPNYLSMIETGKKQPSVGLLEKIAQVLDVPVSYLFAMGIEEDTLESDDVRPTLLRLKDLLGQLEAIYRETKSSASADIQQP